MDNLFRQQMSALATKTEVGLDSELVETKIQKSSIAYSPGRAPANMGHGFGPKVYVSSAISE